MNKILKGCELVKEIAEGNIKGGTKVNKKVADKYIEECYIEGKCIYSNKYGELGVSEVMASDVIFEIIGEPEEINIQDIEEANGTYFDGQEGYNILLRAIKQLDKQIKELKEINE